MHFLSGVDIGQLRGTADDGRISEEEAATSRATLDELRLRFLTDLQGQLGSTSPLIAAFNLLNTAMLTASTGAATLGTAIDRMGQVYVQLAALLPAGTIANGDDIGRVATNLAALIAAVAGPEAVTGIPAIGNLKTSLEGLGTALRNHEGAFSGELLGHIGLGLQAVGIALDTLSGVAVDPARIAATTAALSGFLRNGLAPAASPVTTAAFETVRVGLGILTGSVLGAASLTQGIPLAVANLNDATHGMPALTRILGTPIPSLQGLIGKFGELSLPDGSGPIATMKTAMDALKLAMSDPSAGLIKALADLNTWVGTVIRTITGNTGPTNPAMPSIDRSPLSGDTIGKFQTLAGRAIGFASAANGAGFTDQQIHSSDAWAWAVQQRQAIIGAATDSSALEQILSTYYGGTHTRTAYAGTDQGINEILDRIAAIGGSTNPATGMAAAYRAYLADHPVRTGSEDQGYQTYVAAPDSQDAFNIAHWLGSPSPGAPTQVPWYDAWARWWSAGHVMADIDRFALGGVLNGPTYFMQGNGRIGVGGEAGSEGLFPLARTSGGQLGVRAVNDNGGVLGLQEARDLRAQVVRLTAINLRIADSLDRYRAEQAERDETASRKGDRRTTRDRLLGGTGRG